MHQRHKLAFLDANPVLTSQTPTHLNTVFHHLATSSMHPLKQCRIIWVGTQQHRVEVPVASVEELTRANCVALTDAIHLVQHLSQATTGDGDIDGIISGHFTSDRPTCTLACLPDSSTFLIIASDPHAMSPITLQDLYDLLHLRLKALHIAIDLDNQDRPCI